MTKIRTFKKAIFAIMLLAAVAVGAIRINAVETPKKIRVIYSGDMNGYWQPCG